MMTHEEKTTFLTCLSDLRKTAKEQAEALKALFEGQKVMAEGVGRIGKCLHLILEAKCQVCQGAGAVRFCGKDNPCQTCNGTGNLYGVTNDV